MRKPALIILALLILGGALPLLTACNTTAGVGQDVSAVGHGVTNAARNVKDRL